MSPGDDPVSPWFISHNLIVTITNTTPPPSKWWESFSSSPPPLPHHHWKFHEVEPWSMSNHAFLSLISHTKIPTLNSSNSRNYSFSHKNTPWWPSGRCLCFRIVQSNTLNCRSCFLRHGIAGRERWQPPPFSPFVWGSLVCEGICPLTVLHLKSSGLLVLQMATKLIWQWNVFWKRKGC